MERGKEVSRKRKLNSMATIIRSSWDRMTDEQKERQIRLHGRPLLWTSDPAKAGTIDETGRVFVLLEEEKEAIEIVEDGETKVVKGRKRADGKLDRRGKGLRKCGRCGGTGHNRRTCTR